VYNPPLLSTLELVGTTGRDLLERLDEAGEAPSEDDDMHSGKRSKGKNSSPRCILVYF
jgi:hypothetical protein